MRKQAQKSIGEQNYETFAERYAAAVETKPHNALYERPATRSLIPDVRGQRVLDAGCGPGIWTEWLLEHGASVIAIDVTPAFIAITRRRVGERAEIRQHDLMQPLDFVPDASCDGVLCPLVLDYIEDWEPLFREFHRVLKPGGWLVYSSGHPFGDWLYLQRHEYPGNNYFATMQFTLPWHGFGQPEPLVTSYRRPLGAMINPLLRAGFRLDTLLEPLPTDAFREADPEGYERLMQQPGFLCVRAQRD